MKNKELKKGENWRRGYLQGVQEIKGDLLNYWREMGYTSKKKNVMGGQECIGGTRLTVNNLLRLDEK